MLTRGGQITINNIRMLMQVNAKITKVALIIFFLISIATIYALTPHDVLKAGTYYYIAELMNHLWLGHRVLHYTYHGQLLSISADHLVSEHFFIKRKDLLKHDMLYGIYLALGICCVFTFIVISFLIRRGKQQAKKRFVRGSQIAKPKELASAIKEYGASDIKVSGVPMVNNFEVQHTLIHGTIGTGKSVTIMEILDQIRKRGDSAIIFDKGCTYIENYYRNGSDIILNPFDARCVGWDMWAECKSESDYVNIAESLIPMESNVADPYWTNAARTVFQCTAYKMKDDPERSLGKLIKLLISAELDDLSSYLQGTAAASLVTSKIEKTAISIRSVLTTYLKSLKFMASVHKNDHFSIKRWLAEVAEQGHQSQFCFISSLGEQHASLRPLISMWLSMASLSLLSLAPNKDRRIWVIIDELPTLHKLPQLGETIAEVRKFGGCFLLGMQSLSQLKKIYGAEGASEIFDLLNTRFYFRSPSSDMARLVKNELGHQEIEKSDESYSYGANTIRDGISIGTRTTRRELVTEAEIMNLENLKCYLRVPADLPCCLLDIKPKNRPHEVTGFIKSMTLEIEENNDKAQDDENEESSGNPDRLEISTKITAKKEPVLTIPEESIGYKDTKESENVIKKINKEEEKNIISKDVIPKKEYIDF